MGTRSTIKFIEKWENGCDELVNIYQQYDGYIDGVGKELARWLLSKTLVNGFRFGMKMKTYANGVGCLAAQYIKEFKNEIGDLYLVSLSDTEEYNYKVIIDSTMINGNNPINNIITIIITDYTGKEIFTGSPRELLSFNEDDWMMNN